MAANAIKEEIPFGVKWDWDEMKNCLTYKTSTNNSEKNDKKKKNSKKNNKLRDAKIDLRSGVPRLTTQNRQKEDKTSTNKKSEKKSINTHINISDVMNASVNMLSERYYIPVEFESYCNNPNSRHILENFLLHLTNYFYWYFESIDSREVHNPVCIERNDIEKARINKADLMLKRLVKSLARCYCMLILGLKAEEYHHMNSGKNLVSSGFKDRGLYETFYPYCTFFIWITFKRRDYELVRREIGRLLRSNAFNSKIKVENILDEDQMTIDTMVYSNNLEFLRKEVLEKYQQNKTVLEDFRQKIERQASSAQMLGQRSPALVSILPRPEEKGKYLFDRRHGGLHHKNFIDSEEDRDIDPSELIKDLGIIGQPMKGFHVKTLAPRGNNEEENTNPANGESNHVDGENQSSTINAEAQPDGKNSTEALPETANAEFTDTET